MKINLETMFIHKLAWISMCDFAYTSPDDAWGIPNYYKHCKLSNIDELKHGDMIFITPCGIEDFMRDVHPKIKVSYCLLTYCYGPVSTMERYINDPKILYWFGTVNGDAIKFDKYIIMPLGIFADEKLFWDRTNVLKSLNELANKPKTSLLCSNFIESPHGNRREALSYFKNKAWCKMIDLTPTWRMPWRDYMADMANYKFVLSPEGDLHDTYRIYESLLVGSIPILHRSPIDSLFKDLPIVTIDSWNEVTEDFLNMKYEEIQKRKLNKEYNMEKLYVKYWVDLLNARKGNK